MSKALTDKGYSVFFAPEVPTVLLTGGCLPQLLTSFGESAEGNHAALVAFETQLLKLQLQQEDAFNKIAASSGKPSVVFFDRGSTDVPAYLPDGRSGEQWKAILKENGWDEQDLLDRYDLVLHLVTA